MAWMPGSMHCFARGLEVEVVIIISRASPRRSQRGARQLEGIRENGQTDEGCRRPSREHGCQLIGAPRLVMSGGKQSSQLDCSKQESRAAMA